jgi:hypothetical protein
MAYDEKLAERLRAVLADEPGVTETKMFGGLAFLLDGNMSVGITGGDDLMVRVGPDEADDSLARPHTKIFDMVGRPMRGWVLVEPEGVKTRKQLAAWVARGVAFARSLPPK